MLLDAFVTCLALTLSAAAPPSPRPSAAPPSARPSASPAARRTAGPAAAPRSDDLYSLRARRRFASYLRLRLLELREAGLERAAAAVERRLSADRLLAPPP